MVDDNNDEVVELELSPTLKQTGIVTSFVLHRNNKTIELLLNHKYESKTVVFPVDRDIDNWTKFTDDSEKKLKKKGIDNQHIPMLLDVLDDNWKKISELLRNDKESDTDSNLEEKKNAAQKALSLAEEQCSKIFVDQFGTAYAAVK